MAAYCEGYGFEDCSFRFVSLLGPRYSHGHVLDFVKQLVVDPGHLRILGEGTQRKSYLHVEDGVRAVMHSCEDSRPGPPRAGHYDVYHLGIPQSCLVSESVHWICDEMGVHPQLEFGIGNRGWIGDNPFVLLDVRKAMGTGWSPAHSIEASVRHTVRWLLDNQWLLHRRR